MSFFVTYFLFVFHFCCTCCCRISTLNCRIFADAQNLSMKNPGISVHAHTSFSIYFLSYFRFVSGVCSVQRAIRIARNATSNEQNMNSRSTINKYCSFFSFGKSKRFEVFFGLLFLHVCVRKYFWSEKTFGKFPQRNAI